MESHVDELIEAYALDALTATERAEVERHLSGCERCRAQTAKLSAAVQVLLQDSEPVTPSPQLKQRLFARIDADLARRQVLQRETQAQRTPWWSRPLVRFAFVAALLVVMLGAFGWAQRHEVQLPLTGSSQGAQARLVMWPSLSIALLTVQGLSPLPAEQTYELWFLRDGQPHRANCFNGAAGTQTLLVRAPQTLANFQQAGITHEPNGCSEQPNLAGLLFLGPLN